MTQHKSPLFVAEGGGLAAMGIGQLGGFLDVLDQIGPGRGEALIGLGFCSALNQSFDHPSCRYFFAAAVEDLFLKLSDQGISLIAQLDGELRHRTDN